MPLSPHPLPRPRWRWASRTACTLSSSTTARATTSRTASSARSTSFWCAARRRAVGVQHACAVRAACVWPGRGCSRPFKGCVIGERYLLPVRRAAASDAASFCDLRTGPATDASLLRPTSRHFDPPTSLVLPLSPSPRPPTQGAHQAEAHGAGDPPPGDDGRGVRGAQRERDDRKVRDHGRRARARGEHPHQVGTTGCACPHRAGGRYPSGRHLPEMHLPVGGEPAAPPRAGETYPVTQSDILGPGDAGAPRPHQCHPCATPTAGCTCPRTT